MEIKQRVDEEIMSDTLSSLQDVIQLISSTMRALDYYVFDESTSHFVRVEQAVDKLTAMTRDDIANIHANVIQHIEAYQQELAPTRDSVRHLLDEAYRGIATIPTISLYTLINQGLYDENKLREIISRTEDVMDTINTAADALLVVELTDGFNTLQDFFQHPEPMSNRKKLLNANLLPYTLVARKENRNTCQKDLNYLRRNMTRFGDELNNIIDLLNKVLPSVQAGTDDVQFVAELVPRWHSQLNQKIPIIKSLSNEVMSCADEYHTFLQRIVDAQIMGDMQSTTSLWTSVDLHYRLEEQLVALKVLYDGYASFEISKYELASMIDSNIEDSIDDIFTESEKKINDRLVFPILSRLSDTEQTLTDQYLSAFNDVVTFQKYFNQSKGLFNQRTNNASLWRKPYLDIESSDLLRFSLSRQAGRSSVPDNMENFLATTARGGIQSIISSYINELKDTISVIETEIVTTHKRAVQSSLSKLIKDLLSYADDTQLGSTFVR